MAWAGALALGALHVVPWNPLLALAASGPDAPILLGVLPAELAWRLVWIALAWAYLVWFSIRVWGEPA